MAIKELLETRRRTKRRKPEFVKQDAHKKVRIQHTWRKPKGSGSKMRLARRGYRRPLQVGWGAPAEVKGMDRSGLMPVMVHTADELANLDPKKNIAIIAASVGAKKKIAIIEQAGKKGIKIANFKDAAAYARSAQESVEKRKKERQQTKDSREKKKESDKKEADKKKAKEQKKEEEKPVSEEEKKLEEKKEKDKMLISTQ